ncbi:MAG: FlgD immunoglobulin-like domain containing protein [bacterium]
MKSSLLLAAILVTWLTPLGAAADPVQFIGNGNDYEFVDTQTTWANAVTAAASRTYLGVGGHLATITTAAENDFLSSAFASGQAAYFGWIGGYEPGDDGVWLWGAGPESGVQFAQGAASTPPYNYVNWGGVEPNDFAPGEDFAAINLGASFAGVPPGAWIDSPNPNPSDPIRGYIVEYETATSVDDLNGSEVVRVAPSLRAISPNPMLGMGAIFIDAPEAADMVLMVFDPAGRRVRTLVAGSVSSGTHRITWDGRDENGRRVAEGVYYFRLSTDSVTETRKAVLFR